MKKAMELHILTKDEILLVHLSKCKGRRKMGIYSSKYGNVPKQHLIQSFTDLADATLPKEYSTTEQYQGTYVHGKPVYRFTSTYTSNRVRNIEPCGAQDDADPTRVIANVSQYGICADVLTNMETQESTRTMTRFSINIQRISETTQKLREHLNSPPPPSTSPPPLPTSPPPPPLPSDWCISTLPDVCVPEQMTDLMQEEEEANLIIQSLACDMFGEDDSAFCLEDWLANVQSDMTVLS